MHFDKQDGIHFRCCGTDAAMKILGQRLHHVADEGVQCQIGSQLPKEYWSGPRTETRHPLAAWGAGVPPLLSRIDPLLGTNTRNHLAG